MSDRPEKTDCRRCGASIVWCTNARTTRAVPIDWWPAKNGVWELDTSSRRPIARRLDPRTAKDTTARGGALFNNHLHTCMKRDTRR